MTVSEFYKTYFDAHTQVSIDSRKVDQHTLFFALEGEQVDGNQYAQKAVQAGAKLAIVDKPEFASEKCILVDNSLQFLQELAQFHRQQFDIPVIGITGTNGKTTTKELLFHCLNQRYEVACTQGNFNNHIGVPLSLFEIGTNTQIAIIEMGANHQAEIGELCVIAQPTHTCIVSIGKAHIEGFGSEANILKTKKEIFDYVVKHEQPFFMNQQDAKVRNFAADYPHTVAVGAATHDKILHADPALHIQVANAEEIKTIQSNLFGSYNFTNIMLAIHIAQYFEVTLSQCKTAIESYQPSNIRSQIMQTDRNQLILDAYNANPSSMQLALESFANLRGTHKLAILGEMAELGEQSFFEHQKLAEWVNALPIEQVYFVGASFENTTTHANSCLFKSTQELKQHLQNTPLTDKQILIKGSRSNQLDTLVEFL